MLHLGNPGDATCRMKSSNIQISHFDSQEVNLSASKPLIDGNTKFISSHLKVLHIILRCTLVQNRKLWGITDSKEHPKTSLLRSLPFIFQKHLLFKHELTHNFCKRIPQIFTNLGSSTWTSEIVIHCSKKRISLFTSDSFINKNTLYFEAKFLQDN